MVAIPCRASKLVTVRFDQRSRSATFGNGEATGHHTSSSAGSGASADVTGAVGVAAGFQQERNKR